ncbi:site-2 protease family protein [Chondrinema litorale]|uniref:site-2 protease family protein n=1 Tax=Chondrinema litorale TaxID=2994555 RepID=UPI002542741A|nr:site-2 protease family protein [Chondrinema litorale]UZR92723.1 site-2 protease family protein [Chondrinema litorale]
MKKGLLHLFLFLLTFTATTFAGMEWTAGRFITIPEGEDWTFLEAVWRYLTDIEKSDLIKGLTYSIPFLTILTFHEFGHYFTAKYYKLKVTLPFYIPFWFLGLMPAIGTMGAFIRIKSMIRSRKEFFDVGIAGPLAGFIVALFVIFYGFTHLPEPDYIYEIHPEYKELGANYEEEAYKDLPEGANLQMGTNLLYEFCKAYLVDDPARIPNPHEIMHYPWLLAGFLACFFTALNLIPIGQLDGGHILYGLIGSKKHRIASPAFFVLFIFIGGLGIFSIQDFVENFDYNMQMVAFYLLFLFFVFDKLSKNKLHIVLIVFGVFSLQLLVKYIFPEVIGFSGWLVFGLLLGRVLGVYHPETYERKPLDTKRKVIGWISLIIFVISFSPAPFIIT